MFKASSQSGMVSEVYLRSQLVALWNGMEPEILETEYQRGWMAAMTRLGVVLGMEWVDTLPVVRWPSTNEGTNLQRVIGGER